MDAAELLTYRQELQTRLEGCTSRLQHLDDPRLVASTNQQIADYQRELANVDWWLDRLPGDCQLIVENPPA